MTPRLHEHRTDAAMEPHLQTFRRTLDAYPVGTCPLAMELTMLHNAKTQSCGKCVPCRDGLPQLEGMLQSLLDGDGEPADRERRLQEMRALAELVRDTSDCAIGYQPATVLLGAMTTFEREFDSHVHDTRCLTDRRPVVPCVSLCPAHTDVPGYIALIEKGDHAAAINLIRENNPLPSACALVCEHPCEMHCRRRLIDEPINIRGLKEYAVDHAPGDEVPVPTRGPATGRRIAVVGSGPSGLTAAWFLALMGHEVVIFEANEKPGGMLRYGIPGYRFPKHRLDSDIAGILALGTIEIRCGVRIGRGTSLQDLREEYDSVYVAIGAQAGLTLDIEGGNAEGVMSAVDVLHGLAEDDRPDFRGKRVVVIGGGNVAMDATRTAIRCGAEHVHVVYRRRREDMTALPHEIVGAVREGARLSALFAPTHIEKDDRGAVAALWVQPQMPGPHDHAGRPTPVPADKPAVRLPADVVLIAVGQGIESTHFAESALPLDRTRLVADDTGRVLPHVYSGGDCVSGPSTVIEAIAAGKVAAYAIDEELGYHHTIDFGIEVPHPGPNNRVPTGRVEAPLREPDLRRTDFDYVGERMTAQEAGQEVSRCLRCDHYGSGALVGGRS